MARYLIGTALTQKGTVKKLQPADQLRKMLIRQKIAFSERWLHPLHDRIDLELKNACWDRERRTHSGAKMKTDREWSSVTEYPAYEFTWNDEGVKL